MYMIPVRHLKTQPGFLIARTGGAERAVCIRDLCQWSISETSSQRAKQYLPPMSGNPTALPCTPPMVAKARLCAQHSLSKKAQRAATYLHLWLPALSAVVTEREHDPHRVSEVENDVPDTSTHVQGDTKVWTVAMPVSRCCRGSPSAANSPPFPGCCGA